MATTHALLGLLAAAGVALAAPEYGTAAALGAAAGGLLPDLDILAGAHRRTLHYPVYGWLLALPAVAAAALAPSPLAVGVALAAVSAVLHAATDVLGGGLAPRPWDVDDHRGVYDHARRRWVRPRKWVRYDGAPEDLLLAAALAVPSLLVFDGPVRALVLAGLAVSAAYTVVRKRLPEAALGRGPS